MVGNFLTNHYLKRLTHHALPQFSDEKTDIRRALDEWFWNGSSSDLIYGLGKCELCGQGKLRFEFELENALNENKIMVGSECIRRFSLPAVIDGVIHTAEQTSDRIKVAMKDMAWEYRKSVVWKSLKQLKRKVKDFPVFDFKDTFEKRGFFSPSETLALLKEFRKYGIAYDAESFKLNIHTRMMKDDLHNLSGDEVCEYLEPIMTPIQSEHVHKHMIGGCNGYGVESQEQAHI